MTAPSFPRQLAKLDQARLRAYTANLAFYGGKQWPARRGSDKRRRLTMNYARTVIEKTAAYVTSGRTIRITPQDASDPAAELAINAEQLLADIAEANSLERLDFDTEIDTSVLGDGAYRLTWSEDENRVVITAPDVQGIFVWPKPHNLTDYYQVAHRYEIDQAQALELYGITIAKAKATVIERWTDELVETWLDDTIITSIINPYGLIPYVVFPTSPIPKQFWGLSDIDALREPALELNRELSVLSGIMELSGNPIAVLAGITETQDIAVDPGATWTIPAEAKAYLLDLLSGGGVALHIEYVNAIYRALHDLSETPRTTFGDTGRALSGVALQMEIQPLLQKGARKRLIRTHATIRRSTIALKLHDQASGTQHANAGRVNVNWGEVTPEDKPENTAREVALVQAGLSAPTSAMSRLGVDDPEAEWEKYRTEMLELPQPAPSNPPP